MSLGMAVLIVVGAILSGMLLGKLLIKDETKLK